MWDPQIDLVQLLLFISFFFLQPPIPKLTEPSEKEWKKRKEKKKPNPKTQCEKERKEEEEEDQTQREWKKNKI